MFYDAWEKLWFSVVCGVVFILFVVGSVALFADHRPVSAYVGKHNCVYSALEWDEDTVVGCFTTTAEAATAADKLTIQYMEGRLAQ